MLLRSYRKKMFRSKCHSGHESLHCHAHLDQEIGAALPYLLAELDADGFIADPPSLTFKWHGKLVTLHSNLIAINALADATEADNILNLLCDDINDAWERRETIEPRFQLAEKPKLLEILRLLPRTNCGKCAQPSCMAFAGVVAEGGMDEGNCPELSEELAGRIAEYLAGFHGGKVREPVPRSFPRAAG
jgi:ArsR family metal-binding transcriptional regulator